MVSQVRALIFAPPRAHRQHTPPLNPGLIQSADNVFVTGKSKASQVIDQHPYVHPAPMRVLQRRNEGFRRLIERDNIELKMDARFRLLNGSPHGIQRLAVVLQYLSGIARNHRHRAVCKVDPGRLPGPFRNVAVMAGSFYLGACIFHQFSGAVLQFAALGWQAGAPDQQKDQHPDDRNEENRQQPAQAAAGRRLCGITPTATSLIVRSAIRTDPVTYNGTDCPKKLKMSMSALTSQPVQ